MAPHGVGSAVCHPQAQGRVHVERRRDEGCNPGPEQPAASPPRATPRRRDPIWARDIRLGSEVCDLIEFLQQFCKTGTESILQARKRGLERSGDLPKGHSQALALALPQLRAGPWQM